LSDTILRMQRSQVIRLPREKWEEHLSQLPRHAKTRLDFMSEAHHRVRDLVVRELPRLGRPIQPGFIAQRLELSLARVQALLDDLEENLFFLVRNNQGAVCWAFPMTVERTPHRLAFSTGERLFGA
jgi:hypothetical protein